MKKVGGEESYTKNNENESVYPVSVFQGKNFVY
jgi:hypothetical protein